MPTLPAAIGRRASSAPGVRGARNENEKLWVCRTAASQAYASAGIEIVRLLDDPSERVKSAAMQALIELRCPEAVPLLLQKIRDGPEETRPQAEQLLVMMAASVPLPKLVELLSDMTRGRTADLPMPTRALIAFSAFMRWIGWWAVPLGAVVSGVRRRVTVDRPDWLSSAGTPDELRAFLAAADVVVIAAPQTRDTRGLLGAAELAVMRRDALVVNVSRGKLIDEAALVDALTNGTIGGAALDVFAHEPLAADSPLWDMPNVLITPHTSGFRPDHWDRATALFADNLRRFERGEPLLNLVDKAAGY